jgi:hypothetical protein
MTVIERWDDDHCPQSQNGDGSHCAHADTHDVCDWCGAHWGEGGAMTVPVEQLRGAVDALGELRAASAAFLRFEGGPKAERLRKAINAADAIVGGQ